MQLAVFLIALCSARAGLSAALPAVPEDTTPATTRTLEERQGTVPKAPDCHCTYDEFLEENELCILLRCRPTSPGVGDLGCYSGCFSSTRKFIPVQSELLPKHEYVLS
jgi:hypothetical protein